VTAFKLICVNQMLILSSTRQRSRICDVLSTLAERRYFDVVRRHINQMTILILMDSF